MPASPRNKNVKVQALVNLSLVRQVKGFDGNMQPHGRLVNKGEVVELTEAEVANFGRFVRVINDDNPVLDKVPSSSPAKTFGLSFGNGTGDQLKGSGAMDMGEHTSVIRPEEQSVWEDASEGI